MEGNGFALFFALFLCVCVFVVAQKLADHFPSGSYCKVLNDILAAALTNKCWVFDLYSTEPDAPDFKSSLLSCLINGLGHPASDDETTLARKLTYAIMWQRHDVLLKVLEATGLAPSRRTAVLNGALIEALARDEVAAVRILLDGGANIDMFKIQGRSCKDEKEDQMNLVHKSIVHMSALGANSVKSDSGEELADKTHRQVWSMLYIRNRTYFSSGKAYAPLWRGEPLQRAFKECHLFGASLEAHSRCPWRLIRGVLWSLFGGSFEM